MKGFLDSIDLLIEWLKGKKTYLVAIVYGLIGIVDLFGYKIPPEVYTILQGLGLATIGAKINRNLL